MTGSYLLDGVAVTTNSAVNPNVTDGKVAANDIALIALVMATDQSCGQGTGRQLPVAAMLTS